MVENADGVVELIIASNEGVTISFRGLCTRVEPSGCRSNIDWCRRRRFDSGNSYCLDGEIEGR